MINDNSLLVLSKKFRLQWEKSQGKHVLLYAEGMVELNDSAAEVLLLCDGKHTARDIIQALEEKFSSHELDNDVNLFLGEAIEKGWVTYN